MGLLEPFFVSRRSILEWAVAGRPIHGERLSGDTHVVATTPNGMLVAVIDGLGHGTQARIAARAAADAAIRYADAPLTEIVRHCHEEIRTTRGAVLSLAFFRPEDDTMTWLGVGNVTGMLFRENKAGVRSDRYEGLFAQGGVVGYRLPPLCIRTLAIRANDTLIFATDGIADGFSIERPIARSPKRVADEILARYGKTTDDALVLVARYAGS
jgi:negative regulator of sigma-B (phosphoserine phosphatase)